MKTVIEGARRLNGSFCEYVGNFVFGCTGIAYGAATGAGALAAGAAIPAGIGAIALVGMYQASRSKRNDQGHLESEAALKSIIDALADHWRENDPVYQSYEDGSALTRAQSALIETLHKCDMSPATLAAAATDENALPFPERATDIVLAELADLDRAAYGPAGDELAKRFARAVISQAFTAAITNRAFFERFQPYLLVEIARSSGEGIALQRRALDALAALSQQMAAGFDAAETKAAERQDELRRLITGLQANRPTDTINPALLSALAERTDTRFKFEDQLADLIERFDTAQELIERGHSASNLDAFVQAVIQRMADKTEIGDLDGASQEADAALAQWEQEEAARQVAARAGAATILHAGIEADHARGDSLAVAKREIRRVELTVPVEAQMGALWKTQSQYKQDGDRFGRRLDLQVVRDLSDLRLAGALDDRERWGAFVFKGNALATLGARGQDGALEEAVTAYRAALTVYTLDAAPMDWAMTQENLALAFEALADAGDQPRIHVEDALTCARGALAVYERFDASYYIHKCKTRIARLERKLAGLD